MAAGMPGGSMSLFVRHFGRKLVFMDIFDIPPGEDFARTIDQRISKCDVLLVIIGKRWVIATGQAGRKTPRRAQRFCPARDCRRATTKCQSDSGSRRRSGMPTQDLLPEAISQLAQLNALVIYDQLFQQSIGRLIALVATSVKVPPSYGSAYLKEQWRSSPARVLSWMTIAIIALLSALVLTIRALAH